MKVRHLFTTSPSVRMPNGAQVSPADLPSTTNIEYFVSGILSVLTGSANCSVTHNCSKNCVRSIIVQLGAPHNCNLVSACPSEVYDLVKDFEHLLAVFLYDHNTSIGERTVVRLNTAARRWRSWPCHSHRSLGCGRGNVPASLIIRAKDEYILIKV